MVVRGDLNNPQVHPDDGGDWSTRALVEVRCREIARWVTAQVPVLPVRILEVGCGNGYLALELARAGHAVEAIDASSERIESAEASLQDADRGRNFGSLQLRAIGAESWIPGVSVDVVVFNRSLHHLLSMDRFLKRVRGAMPETGLIICNEYAWDRFDLRSAQWLVESLSRLEADGLVAGQPAETPADVLESWEREAKEEGLKTFDRMMNVLQNHFEMKAFSENPYLFANIAREIRTPDAEEEMRRTRQLQAEERSLIENGTINASGFRFTGSAKS